mmetsp:Transcript_67050/g.178849  ORF Transcript_67050/g.178849 Transcript_67050/m.178849 type:complete len:282 (-) Transcript_67050:871-1716(-)
MDPAPVGGTGRGHAEHVADISGAGDSQGDSAGGVVSESGDYHQCVVQRREDIASWARAVAHRHFCVLTHCSENSAERSQVFWGRGSRQCAHAGASRGSARIMGIVARRVPRGMEVFYAALVRLLPADNVHSVSGHDAGRLAGDHLHVVASGLEMGDFFHRVRDPHVLLLDANRVRSHHRQRLQSFCPHRKGPGDQAEGQGEQKVEAAERDLQTHRRDREGSSRIHPAAAARAGRCGPGTPAAVEADGGRPGRAVRGSGGHAPSGVDVPAPGGLECGCGIGV